MKTDEIRKKFLDFFASKGHSVMESDSLIPKGDPTVLFTTAGMQQFKKQFLGKIDGFTRAVTSQKCLRTDDLDEVGKTDFHHTFFEMLGNFSFGDYFKKEAIEWGWEFLTETCNIPKEKLWVSVYKDDVEAETIWLKDIHIPKNRLVKLGDYSNFWPANAKQDGPNGPCGPCSEIFYDFGPGSKGEGKNSDPGNDPTGRFSEVWNLVFTQFERKEGGVLEPLPNKNIDTGMGLERLAAVLQGKKSNFDTDIFKPILKAINAEIKIKNATGGRNERFVIADHLRAVTFAISDGVIPSNEGRGYVVKKLIVDMADIVIRAGSKKPVIHRLVPSVVTAMGEAYPEIKGKHKEIAEIVHNIENAYLKVRQKRMPELLKEIRKCGSDSKQIGELIFRYRDTYGLTLTAIRKVLDEAAPDGKLQIASLEIYEQFMEQQQQQSRAGSKMTGDVFTASTLEINAPKTSFLGYDRAASTSTVLQLFKGNETVHEAHTGDAVQIVLDKTPFYAESGGQVGDSGTFKTKNALIEISDTQKIDDVFIHIGNVEEGTLKVNDPGEAKIDADRRQAIMCNHTATHLMQAALREVLGAHVQQQGSLVDENRLRFDFTHPKAITGNEICKIENLVNIYIRSCDTVTREYMPIEQARKSGALAFFAEKYGKTVRVVSVGEYSKEFCGGTHLDITGQIGLFKIVSESAIAQGIRRIEAKTGMGAIAHIAQLEHTINDVSKTIKSPRTEITERVRKQAAKLKQLEKDYEILKFEAIKTAIVAGLDDAEDLKGIKIYTKSFKNVEMNMLRKISDFLKKKLPSSLIILGARTEGNASILIASSDDAVKKGYKADELIKLAAQKIGGSGGGRPQLAQAGGNNANNVDQAINELYKEVKKGNRA